MDVRASPLRILKRMKLSAGIPFVLLLGYYVDQENKNQMSRYRGKSKMYGRPEHLERPPW